MARATPPPRFVVWTAAWLAGLAAAAGGVAGLRESALRAQAELRVAESERERLMALPPEASAEWEQELAALAAEIDAGRRRLGFETRVPAEGDGPAEEFFAVEQFVGRMRASALRAGVAVKPDESFGMGVPRESIEPAASSAIRRVLLGSLLELLFAAAPTALLDVRWSKPAVTAGEKSESAGGYGWAVGASLRSEEVPAARAERDLAAPAWTVRLAWAGDVESLRGFLVAVAAAPLPAVATAVAVEPWDGRTASGEVRAQLGVRPPGVQIAVECEALVWSEPESPGP